MKRKESFLIIVITMFVFRKQKNRKCEVCKEEKCPQKIKTKNWNKEAADSLMGKIKASEYFVLNASWIKCEKRLLKEEIIRGKKKKYAAFLLHLIPFQLNRTESCDKRFAIDSIHIAFLQSQHLSIDANICQAVFHLVCN